MEQVWSQTKDNMIRIQHVRLQGGSWLEMQTVERWAVAHCKGAQLIPPVSASVIYGQTRYEIQTEIGHFFTSLLSNHLQQVLSCGALLGSQNILCRLWAPEVHYMIHISPPVILHRYRRKSSHTPTCFLKTHLSIYYHSIYVHIFKVVSFLEVFLTWFWMYSETCI